MKKSLFIAFALSVIASGSLYANDLSKVNDLNAKSRVVANSVAEIIYSHAPIFFGDIVHPHGAHKLPVKYFTELLAEALGVKEG